MSERNSGGKAIVLIANALFWAAAILFASYVFKGQAWAEQLVLWGVAGFMLANGLLTAATGRSGPRC